MRREERYQRVLEHFRREMPTVDTELQFGSVFQLLVAVVLSAQCTDKRVNAVTHELFRRYPDARTMAEAEGGISLAEGWQGRVTLPSRKYALALSSDGKRLVLTRTNGFMLTIR